LRRVAKETNSIIFSIDYKKAPYSKYFDILDTVIEFYLFLTQLFKLLKVNPRIVLYGDSAGGTLISSLCTWIA
jgi:acetyl esterase/lipase